MNYYRTDNTMRPIFKTLMMAFSFAAGMSACTLTFRPIPNSVVVTTAPPRTVVEVQTVTPGPEYVWIDGYWNWSGSSWAWTNGRWETSRAGYYWVTPHYTHSGGKQYYAAGGWTQSSSHAHSNSNKAYSNGNSSNNGYSNGKASNKGYKASSHKCPKGYAWSNNACRPKSKNNKY
jgi:hypothetical protein